MENFSVYVMPGVPWTMLKRIEKLVCDAFGKEAYELHTRSRKWEYSIPRMTVYYLAKKYTKTTYAAMAEYYGQTHANALHGNKQVLNLISTKHPLVKYVDIAEKGVKDGIFSEFDRPGQGGEACLLQQSETG